MFTPRKFLVFICLRSHVSPREVCGGHSGTLRRCFTEYFCFPLSVPFHQCSIFIFIYMSYTYQNDKRANPGNLPKNNALPEIGGGWGVGHWKVLPFFFSILKGFICSRWNMAGLSNSNRCGTVINTWGKQFSVLSRSAPRCDFQERNPIVIRGTKKTVKVKVSIYMPRTHACGVELIGPSLLISAQRGCI